MEEFDINTIKLIIGLGNVGDEFKNTRHNAGFMFLDALANSSFLHEPKFKALTSSLTIQVRKMILAKPSTFMNNSGEAVQLIASFYKINPSEILVVHDDLDLAFGEYKLQFAKGPHIHNGLISIQNYLNSDEFWRLRIGIDNRTPEQREFMSGRDYVLEKFSKKEMDTLEKEFELIVSKF